MCGVDVIELFNLVRVGTQVTYWKVPFITHRLSMQLLQPFPVIGRATHPGGQAETMGVGAECPARFAIGYRTARCQLQAQHFLPRTRVVRDAIVGGGGLQGHHHVIRIDEAARQHHLALFLDEMPKSCQQSQYPRDDLVQ